MPGVEPSASNTMSGFGEASSTVTPAVGCTASLSVKEPLPPSATTIAVLDRSRLASSSSLTVTETEFTKPA